MCGQPSLTWTRLLDLWTKDRKAEKKKSEHGMLVRRVLFAPSRALHRHPSARIGNGAGVMSHSSFIL